MEFLLTRAVQLDGLPEQITNSEELTKAIEMNVKPWCTYFVTLTFSKVKFNKLAKTMKKSKFNECDMSEVHEVVSESIVFRLPAYFRADIAQWTLRPHYHGVIWGPPHRMKEFVAYYNKYYGVCHFQEIKNSINCAKYIMGDPKVYDNPECALEEMANNSKESKLEMKEYLDRFTLYNKENRI